MEYFRLQLNLFLLTLRGGTAFVKRRLDLHNIFRILVSDSQRLRPTRDVCAREQIASYTFYRFTS